MKNAKQSYIITGKDNFITTYNSMEDIVETSLLKMKETFNDREEKMKRISSIQEFYFNYIEYSTPAFTKSSKRS